MQQGIFSPESTFSADSLTCVRTPLCAIASINVCAHVKDLVVQVRVQWIMETLKHPAYIVVWAVWLRRSWISLGKATWISYGRNPIGTIQLLKIKGGGGCFSCQAFMYKEISGKVSETVGLKRGAVFHQGYMFVTTDVWFGYQNHTNLICVHIVVGTTKEHTVSRNAYLHRHT